VGGSAAPCDLPERRALDAQASLARRVGARAVLVPLVLHSRFFYGTVVSSHSYSRRKVSMYMKVSTGFLQEVIDELI
jgi:hypothetical protein